MVSAYRKDYVVEIIVGITNRNIIDADFSESEYDDVSRQSDEWSCFDMSREAMIVARELLPKHLKKYLPEIERVRCDKTLDSFEFVYHMPFYDEYDEYETEYDRPGKINLGIIERTISLAMKKIYRGTGYSKEAMFGTNQSDPMCRFDNMLSDLDTIHEDNLSSHNGCVIYRDPIVCLFRPEDAIEKFAKLFQY